MIELIYKNIILGKIVVINRWFFGQKRVCTKTSHQVDHKITAAPVFGVFHLTGVF